MEHTRNPTNKETLCVHSGTHHDAATRGMNTPIYTSSSFEYLDRQDCPYPRYFNTPNQDAVIAKLCALEGAEDGVLFSSGMAAISTAVLAFAGAGDHVVMMDELYGGTHAFATEAFERLGIRFSFVATDAEAVSEAMTPATKVVVIESPTNPLLGVIDIRRVAEFGKARHAVTIIDNTFATPVNQTPLRLGIDVVVHSGTKYLGGHSDLCCGAALTHSAHASRIRDMARHLGGSLNAITCYLLERSLKTLAVRVERQSQNAMRVAQWLSQQKGVTRINYPGLTEFPGHSVAKAQMQGFGGMLSFELDPSMIDTAGFLRRLKLIRPALSLGGVETLICAPAETSHAKISAEERRRIGIRDSLLRLSVGIEHVQDLIDDLQRGFQA
ncbi:MAG: PLP-dependent aspartate aminotransferase family protein [Thermodesulfobacteriota bacterium]